ncbi:hypothetical protein GL2_37990 [Microbulbifer sp. GL-2]|nr:hypothetical protein GL2_37990 [Microbulbifer sp. GL-2]
MVPISSGVHITVGDTAILRGQVDGDSFQAALGIVAVVQALLSGAITADGHCGNAGTGISNRECLAGGIGNTVHQTTAVVAKGYLAAFGIDAGHQFPVAIDIAVDLFGATGAFTPHPLIITTVEHNLVVCTGTIRGDIGLQAGIVGV